MKFYFETISACCTFRPSTTPPSFTWENILKRSINCKGQLIHSEQFTEVNQQQLRTATAHAR